MPILRLELRCDGGGVQSALVLAQLTARGVTLTVTPAARARLAELGYDPLLGARPLARVIEDKLGRPLADELLFGRLKDGGAVKVGVQGGEFSFAVS